ncbi:hypothetical protein Lser_V15G02900 [Lactuca serriola]
METEYSEADVYKQLSYFCYLLDVDRCIDKVPFELHGPHGVLKHLKYLLETKGSTVICVAEGAELCGENKC